MKEVWSLDKSAVKVYGDYSPHPQIMLKEVVEYFGSTENAFHQMCKFHKLGFSPRRNASESYPFTMVDVNLAFENEQRGQSHKERYWKFGTVYPSSREYVRGYYYKENGYAVFSGGTRVKLPN